MTRIGAIILAAGLSSRMGDFKILLPWTDGKPILWHVIARYTDLKIDPIIVVTGRDAEQVQASVAEMPVQCVYNPNFATGEILSSVKIGLGAMPYDVSATFINPADMPLIPRSVIQQLLDSYKPNHILAPQFQGQRGHPVLLDRVFWQDMLKLSEDGAPRDIIKANQAYLHLLNVDDEGVIVDIDTPEIYQQALKRAK